MKQCTEAVVQWYLKIMHQSFQNCTQFKTNKNPKVSHSETFSWNLSHFFSVTTFTYKTASCPFWTWVPNGTCLQVKHNFHVLTLLVFNVLFKRTFAEAAAEKIKVPQMVYFTLCFPLPLLSAVWVDRWSMCPFHGNPFTVHSHLISKVGKAVNFVSGVKIIISLLRCQE